VRFLKHNDQAHVRESWRVTVDATGEEKTVAGWTEMVKNTFMDFTMTFTVTHVTEKQFKL